MSLRPALKRGASMAKKESGGNAWWLIVPGWLWIASGVGVVFFVALFFLSSSKVVYVRNIVTNSIKVQKPKSTELVFDFYTLLPELPETEVWNSELEEGVNESVHSNKAENGKKGVAIQDVDNKQSFGSYLLQVGSFRSMKDADRLRVELLLWGLSPKVEKANIGNGESWHRVQIGPFKDRESLRRAQQVIAEHNIDSLLLKQR